MSNFIDVDTAKRLAGLQISLLQKFRKLGMAFLDQLEYFLMLSNEERCRICEIDSRFVLVGSPRSFTVPENYDHKTQIHTFVEKFQERFPKIGEGLLDSDYSRTTDQLQPGRTYCVKFFKIQKNNVSSEACLAFMNRTNALMTSAQGLTLVFQELEERIPIGSWIYSLDKKDNLGRFLDNDKHGKDYRGIPRLYHPLDVDNAWETGHRNFPLSHETGVRLLCIYEQTTQPNSTN